LASGRGRRALDGIFINIDNHERRRGVSEGKTWNKVAVDGPHELRNNRRVGGSDWNVRKVQNAVGKVVTLHRSGSGQSLQIGEKNLVGFSRVWARNWGNLERRMINIFGSLEG
jgi:hypothetical protein